MSSDKFCFFFEVEIIYPSYRIVVIAGWTRVTKFLNTFVKDECLKSIFQDLTCLGLISGVDYKVFVLKQDAGCVPVSRQIF